MKKLLLGLGIAPLAIVPIAMAVSCSSNTEEVVKTNFEKQVDKLTNRTFKNQAPLISIVSATTQFNATNADLQTLFGRYIGINHLNLDQFTYAFVETPASNTKGILSVKVVIIEKAVETNRKAITIKINGFNPQDLIDASNKLVTTPKKSEWTQNSSATVKAINEATDKLAELNKVVVVPSVGVGFSIKVISAEVSAINTIIIINIELTNDSTKESMKTSLAVSNFEGSIAYQIK